MFSQIKLDLSDDYNIIALQESNDISISIYHNQTIVGKSRIITDHVDVEFITSLAVEDEHVNTIFNQKHTLGEILIKFLIKFPTIVRKPEFRFICNVPENLKTIIEKNHFDRGTGTSLENEIMIRNQIIFPVQHKISEEFFFKTAIGSDEIQNLLLLLQKNACWQSHLTIDRLNLLIANSKLFFVTTTTGEIIGFSRVLTDNISFASLWDVVIDQAYRGKGLGIALMLQVFSDVVLCKIENWILFTNTAKKLYEKFGFISESELPNRKIVHKFRLQDKHPVYMDELIKIATDGLSVHLNRKQSLDFLFGDSGKREKLSYFWKEVPRLDTTDKSSFCFEKSFFNSI